MRIDKIMLGAALACLLAATLVATPALAGLKVVATLTDLGRIAERVGGPDVEVKVLCPGPSDPHFLPAKPSLAHRLKKADMLVYNGLELEVGWLPQLITKSRNPRVKPGSRGELDCSAAVAEVLEKPTGAVDRSKGDVHPLGNPHYTLDPRNAAAIGRLMAERMAELDPAGAAGYYERADAFAAEIDRRMAGWREKVAAVKDIPLIIYHKHWTYLLHWTGLQEKGEIEHRPGIQPSPRHVQKVIERARHMGRVSVVCAQWDHLDIAREVAERIGAPLAVLPGYSGAVPGSEDYFDFIDMLVDGVAAAGAAGEES